MNEKTYFITGGAGFLGFHICQLLLKRKNIRVVVYDKYRCYVAKSKNKYSAYLNYRRDILQKFGKRVIFIEGDVRNKTLLKKYLAMYNPEVVMHLAAVPVASVCNKKPALAGKVMWDGTFNLLESIRELNISPKIIYTSSSMVYGDFLKNKSNQVLMANEEQKCEPINIYGAIKLAGEHLVKAYGKVYKIPYVIIRPSAIYGPTDCNRRVTEIFIENSLAGQELILDNDGKSELDFTFVEDVARGFVLTAENSKAVGKTLNITRGEGRSLNELASIVSCYVPEVRIKKEGAKANMPERGGLDISSARKILKFQPRYSLEEGIKKYFKFINKRNGYGK